MIYKLLFSLILSCLILPFPTINKKDIQLNISNNFSYTDQYHIRKALNHFEDKVPCIKFIHTPLKGDPIQELKVLKIQRNIALPKPKIAQYQHLLNRIVILPRIKGTLLQKTILHEVAHALGMPSHPFKYSEDTHLSRSISDKTPTNLSHRDIAYLNNLICKNTL